MDLSQHIDIGASECLNTDDQLVPVLKGEKPVSSDADAQLMFNIVFLSETKVSTLSILAPGDGTFNHRDMRRIDSLWNLRLRTEDLAALRESEHLL